MTPETALQERVLVLMPSAKDSQRTVGGLSAAGFQCVACADVPALCAEIQLGAAAALLTEEAMLNDHEQRLAAILRDEPSWSNFPLIVLAQSGRTARHLPAAQMLNVTLVERPVRFVTLRSVVDSALRHRRHQYQVRDTLVELRRSAESLALLAAVVENSDDAIITKNLDGIITSWNKGAERMFGYAPDEAVGQHIGLLIPPDRLEEEPRILARLRRGESIDHFETVRRCKDGTLLNVWLTISPVRDTSGRIIGASKIARDVTELHKTREELARSNRELEQRVAERTASLEQALVQMEEFTYSVSHDLRAPARVIRGLADAAMEDYGTSIPDELRDFLAKISTSGQRMEQLIRDILDYSRVARAQVQLAPVELNSLVQAVITDSPELQPPKATVQVRTPLHPVLAHQPSLIQAITNLLANAVKFVAPGVHPNVEVWTELVKASANGSHQPAMSNGHSSSSDPLDSQQSTTNHCVRLWVRDNGIGINPKYHHRLFQLFERVHTSATYEGTGIGLAIVRKAAEKMGGKVGVLSEVSRGSSFWLELPAPSV